MLYIFADMSASSPGASPCISPVQSVADTGFESLKALSSCSFIFLSFSDNWTPSFGIVLLFVVFAVWMNLCFSDYKRL